TWPHREARAEGTVLRRWAGDGAVLVHEHDPERYALLLERCRPGTELGRAGHIPAEERLLLGAGVLDRLWAAGEGDTPPDVERLSDVAAEWAGLAEERAARRDWPAGVDTGLFTLAAALLRELPGGAERETLLHGDFNPGNLLAAERAPWLAIDAKPMYGDPAFDPWRLIEQIDDPFTHPEPRRVLTRRTALVADALGEDVDRVRAWAVARHMEHALWSVDESAQEDEALSGSTGLLRQARTLADVAGL
ncbi:MAG: aminoglycoside phosphotransferase family protein, partial [Streptomyces sp.]|uniref:aminoglycoside phosphotransferase family protein n=1 Tax=Streptomyces sp. TaxID=1931 RepID=UPI003D6A57C4